MGRQAIAMRFSQCAPDLTGSQQQFSTVTGTDGAGGAAAISAAISNCSLVSRQRGDAAVARHQRVEVQDLRPAVALELASRIASVRRR